MTGVQTCALPICFPVTIRFCLFVIVILCVLISTINSFIFAIKAFIILLGTDYLILLFGNVYLGIRLFIEIYWGIFISEKVLGDTLFWGTPTWVKREFSLGSCNVGIGLCV